MRTVRAAYLVIGATLAAFVAALVAVIRLAPSSPPPNPAGLIQPVVALALLTAIVTLLMVVFRNLAVARGAASLRYFRSYADDQPAEWVERPARAYMNVLELPVLFYVVCALMLITGRFDSVQVALAWLFVFVRYAHAIVHIGFNYVPLRFVAYLSGVLALMVIWTRFAAQNAVG